MAVCSVSVVFHASLTLSLQFICLGSAANVPVTGATATVAPAIPGVNRGNNCVFA
jgi:hypothetical protein